jgi:hypothetical protein
MPSIASATWAVSANSVANVPGSTIVTRTPAGGQFRGERLAEQLDGRLETE